MAQETKKTKQEGIAVEEMAALQARLAARQLEPEDWTRLGKLLSSFLSLVQMLEHPKLKLRQIRRKLFGDQPEPPAPLSATDMTTPAAPASVAVSLEKPETQLSQRKEIT